MDFIVKAIKLYFLWGSRIMAVFLCIMGIGMVYLFIGIYIVGGIKERKERKKRWRQWDEEAWAAMKWDSEEQRIAAEAKRKSRK